MTAEERRQALERVLGSETFRHAASLRRLLNYLGEKSLNGEADQLKEYTVGIEAFGKPPSYNPQHDASVRVQAAKLRQKLEEYYRAEGAGDPIRIVFPKGRFKLEFLPHSQRPGVRRTIGLYAGWAVAAALAAILLGFSLRSEPGHGLPWNRAMEEIWEPFLRSPRPVLICLGTPMFVHFGPVFVRDPQLNEPQDLENSPFLQALRSRYPELLTVPTYLYTGVGEAMGAVDLVRLLASRGRTAIVKRSSNLSWEDVEKHDVIFLGSTKFNPQLKDLPGGLELVMQPGRILNLKPRPGEAAILQGHWPDSEPYRVSDYALITRIQGLHQRGEIMILGANSTEGTLAAVWYVTRPSHAAELVSRLKTRGQLPRHYQVVLHARLKQGIPIQIAYQFHRVLGEQPR